ncbi:MAG: triose-phosphate isomerase [Candidatus Riflebacteria bacterium]|nr:triose-phosphate isomerase [Candidatus Riflebacteria bacterium]
MTRDMMTAMRALVLISDVLKRADLSAPPFNLAPEEVFLTGYEYLAYLGIRSDRFAAVLLHQPPDHILPKLALGLRDDSTLEAIWDLLNPSFSGHAGDGLPGSIPVRILVSAPCRPLSAWFDLGLEQIIPADCRKLLLEAADSPHGGHMNIPNPRSAPLTADDIRDLHQQGKHNVDASLPMTDWARETAVSLGMTLTETSRPYRLLRLRVNSRHDIAVRRENLHSWAHADRELLFVVPAPLWPAFAEMAPSLRSRMVAPSVFVEEKGAFTGEISLGMVIDAGCRGAILPASPAYTGSKHLASFLKHAARSGIAIFSPSPLESLTEYDIMTARDRVIPLQCGLHSASSSGQTARLIEEDEFSI